MKFFILFLLHLHSSFHTLYETIYMRQNLNLVFLILRTFLTPWLQRLNIRVSVRPGIISTPWVIQILQNIFDPLDTIYELYLF